MPKSILTHHKEILVLPAGTELMLQIYDPRPSSTKTSSALLSIEQAEELRDLLKEAIEESKQKHR